MSNLPANRNLPVGHDPRSAPAFIVVVYPASMVGTSIKISDSGDTDTGYIAMVSLEPPMVTIEPTRYGRGFEMVAQLDGWTEAYGETVAIAVARAVEGAQDR